MIVDRLNRNSGWYKGSVKAFRRFLIILVLVLAWLVVGKLGLIDHNRYDAGTLIVAVLLFFFGLPLSALLRIDNLSDLYGITDSRLALVLAMVVALINFLMIGALLGMLRARRSSKQE